MALLAEDFALRIPDDVGRCAGTGVAAGTAVNVYFYLHRNIILNNHTATVALLTGNNFPNLSPKPPTFTCVLAALRAVRQTYATFNLQRFILLNLKNQPTASCFRCLAARHLLTTPRRCKHQLVLVQ